MFKDKKISGPDKIYFMDTKLQRYFYMIKNLDKIPDELQIYNTNKKFEDLDKKPKEYIKLISELLYELTTNPIPREDLDEDLE